MSDQDSFEFYGRKFAKRRRRERAHSPPPLTPAPPPAPLAPLFKKGQWVWWDDYCGRVIECTEDRVRLVPAQYCPSDKHAEDVWMNTAPLPLDWNVVVYTSLEPKWFSVETLIKMRKMRLDADAFVEYDNKQQKFVYLRMEKCKDEILFVETFLSSLCKKLHPRLFHLCNFEELHERNYIAPNEELQQKCEVCEKGRLCSHTFLVGNSKKYMCSGCAQFVYESYMLMFDTSCEEEGEEEDGISLPQLVRIYYLFRAILYSKE